jgi:hypothetical protein
MQYTNVKDPQWSSAAQTEITCWVLWEGQNEYQPFGASPTDSTVYGPEIYTNCVAGVYGEVEPFVPPPPSPPVPPPSAEQNKAKAVQRLLETDWVNQPDVIDPNMNLHLLNQAEFLSYRAALRSMAVNPQPGDLSWPTKPQEQWST